MLSRKHIHIPKPCSEKLENMVSNSDGRFCNSCKKNVIDFRGKNDDFINNNLSKDKQICGIFYSNQIGTPPSFSIWNKSKQMFSFLFSLSLFSQTSYGQENDTLQVLAPTNKIEPEEPQLIIGEVIDYLPKYKYGDHQDLLKFLQKNINYSTDTLQGKVVVRFYVNFEGKVVSSEIIESLSDKRDLEVIRVINLLEFEPRKDKGLYTFHIPIIFSND
jgi:TonB family protein